jgi:uncharacterized spore protein YtfJ
MLPRATKEGMMTEMRYGSDLADELLKRIGHVVGDRVTVATVFGEPVEREGITVIPVARTRFGFGGGGGGGAHGEDHGSGGGGGGGAMVSPAGYIEIRNGAAEYRRIATPADLLALGIAAALAAIALRRLLG